MDDSYEPVVPMLLGLLPLSPSIGVHPREGIMAQADMGPATVYWESDTEAESPEHCPGSEPVRTRPATWPTTAAEPHSHRRPFAVPLVSQPRRVACWPGPNSGVGRQGWDQMQRGRWGMAKL